MSIVVQTPKGPIPTIPKANGRSSGLGLPSYSLIGAGAGRRSVDLLGGTKSFVNIYREQPSVAIACRRLCEQMARLPVHAFRYIDGGDGARDRDRDHPAYELIRRPMPQASAVRWRWRISLAMRVQGNAVVYKQRRRRGQPPVALWPLDWRLLEPIMDGDSGIVAAWRWHGTGIPGVAKGDFIDRGDVMHFAWDGPESEVGVSPLEQLGVTIRQQDAIDRYTDASFKNGTRLGVAVVLSKDVRNDTEARKALAAELAAEHGTPDYAFRSIVLGGGVDDVKPLNQQSAVEAELIDQRRLNREEVAAVYGIPQPLAGILDHATYSNIEQLLGSLFTVFLAPEIALTADVLQRQLIDAEPAWADDGVFFEHNLSEVLRADALNRYRAYAIAVAGGWLTLNDVRRLENRAPYELPEADEPLVQGNNVTPLKDIAADQLRAPTYAIAGDIQTTLERAGLNGQSEQLAGEIADLVLAGGPSTCP